MSIDRPTTHATHTRMDFAPESAFHEAFPANVARMIRLACSAAASFTTGWLRFMFGGFDAPLEARLIPIRVPSENDWYARR